MRKAKRSAAVASAKRATIRDVARRANVSVATVSRVLSSANEAVVSDELKARVMSAVDALNYSPNYIASALKGASTRVVGLLSAEFKSGLAPAILDALQASLRSAGYSMMMAGTASWMESQQEALNALTSRQIDGLVIAPAVTDDPVFDQVVERGLPTVVAYGHSRIRQIPSINVDDKRGMELIVGHLASLGHTRIGCVTGPLKVYSAKSRAEAFVSAMRDFFGSRAHPPIVEVDGFRPSAARPGVHDLVSRHGAVTAVVAVSDNLALGCMDAIEALGRRVPVDVAVTGFGDIPMMDRLRCSLTTVHVPAAEIGAAAGAAVLQLIAGRAQGDVILEPSLVVRESTAESPAVGVRKNRPRVRT